MGAVSAPVAGLYGAYKAGATGSLEEGAKAVRKVQSKATDWIPRSEASDITEAAVAAPFELTKKYVTGPAGAEMGKWFGNEEAGRAIGEAAPDLLLAGKGAKGALESVGKTAGSRGPTKLTQIQSAIQDAKADGFMALPSQANPGVVNAMVEGAGGRTAGNASRVANRIAAKNAEHSSTLAKEEVGLSKGDYLNTESVKRLRAEANQHYADLTSVQTPIAMDAQFAADLVDLDKNVQAAKQAFPELHKDNKLETVRASLSNAASQPLSVEAIVQQINSLRGQASDMLKSTSKDPGQTASAMAIKGAATALEELLDRSLTGPELVKFRAAREQHAKLYQIEEATNLMTGVVDPQKLRTIRERGDKLSGRLEKIAKAAAAMPEVMKTTEGLDTSLAPHLSDMATAGLASGGGMALGHGAAGLGAGAAGLAARPAALAVGSSRPYQRVMANVKPGTQVTREPIAMGDAAALAAPSADDQQYLMDETRKVPQ